MARKRGRVAAHILVWLWVLSQFGYRSNTAGEMADGHGRCVRALELGRRSGLGGEPRTELVRDAVPGRRSSSRIIRANSTFIQLNHRLGATLALLRLLRCF